MSTTELLSKYAGRHDHFHPTHRVELHDPNDAQRIFDLLGKMSLVGKFRPGGSAIAGRRWFDFELDVDAMLCLLAVDGDLFIL